MKSFAWMFIVGKLFALQLNPFHIDGETFRILVKFLPYLLSSTVYIIHFNFMFDHFVYYVVGRISTKKEFFMSSGIVVSHIIFQLYPSTPSRRSFRTTRIMFFYECWLAVYFYRYLRNTCKKMKIKTRNTVK